MKFYMYDIIYKARSLSALTVEAASCDESDPAADEHARHRPARRSDRQGGLSTRSQDRTLYSLESLPSNTNFKFYLTHTHTHTTQISTSIHKTYSDANRR